jgi:CRISPR-associated protein Csm2
MVTIQTIMTQDQTGKELVQFAERTAERLVKDGLTRSQIRNIFTEVRKIEALWEIDPQKAARRLTMLKPKLDYQTSRQRHVKGLQDVLSDAIDLVIAVEDTPDKRERTERFQRFMELFEAILAYHRSKGGRN